MKLSSVVAGVALVAVALGTAYAQKGVADKDLGLSKTSVFDTPAPKAYGYSESFPGASKKLPRAYLGAPPQIPHNIESFIPVTAKNNMCMGCHNRPDDIGKTAEGLPPPMPKSHYTDQRHAPDKMQNKPVGARYVCTQCHVPQAKVDVLVGNSFDNADSGKK